MKKSSCLIAVVVIAGSCWAADNPARARDEHAWWQHAVFYEIYPRSFADSNNDGIGDLNGITAHLDYLERLGIGAIWLTPCYPSPQVDFGYDVADYENIDPAYGTLADFDRLLREAKARGIRIIMDFVVNHTSDQHAWFRDARSSPTAFHRDWYIWRNGTVGKPPNNWLSIFGGSAWSLDTNTAQFYLHQFYPEQPDLNWRNPAVQQAMYAVERVWFERDVAGFRLDAVDRLLEDASFRDNPVQNLPDGRTQQVEVYTKDLPENHKVLGELRRIADQYGDRVLIGETWTQNVAGLAGYYNELQMPMDFLFTTLNRLSAPEFRRQIAAAQHAGGWPVYLLSNHDMPRHYGRYGDGSHNDAIAKLMAALYLTLRGTPILYYGEEIGMQNNDPVRPEDVKDRVGLNDWPQTKGRDGERTPMQWSSAPNAGFSAAKPWLPVPPSFVTHNVAAEQNDANSILNFYRRLISLRRENLALCDGSYTALNESDPNVLSFLRTYKNKSVLVVLNMSAKPQQVAFGAGTHNLGRRAKTLLTSEPVLSRSARTRSISLAPFGVYIGEVN